MRYDKVKILIDQFIKFGMVGLLNTAIGLAIYYILIFFSMNYLIANSVAFVGSVLNSYYLNRKFVFKTSSKILSTLVKTYIVYIITYLIGMVNLYLFVERLNISKIIAPIIVICINVPINFMLNKNWSMK